MKNIFINYNSKLINAHTPIITAQNRGFRYGDGFFETMRWHEGKIVLAKEHFKRLLTTLELLAFDKPKHFTPTFLQNEIEKVIVKNQHQQFARIRLSIFRGNGGLYDVENHHPNYIIETWQLPHHYQLNENGLVINFYEDAKKDYHNFSHLKTNNFLPYTMAALWAKKKQLNDAIILNNHNHVVETTLANIWIAKDDVVKTPNLQQGCIAGVMRKYLLKCLQQEKYKVEENTITIEDILQADEIFITNIIKGIAWVKQCGNVEYKNELVKKIFNRFINSLL